jgi:hypothetical protein
MGDAMLRGRSRELQTKGNEKACVDSDVHASD